MKQYLLYPSLCLALLLILACAIWSPAAIIQAVIPQVVPVANKIGNSTKFQLGASGAVSGDCAEFDSNLNVTGPGTGSGCSGGATPGATYFTYVNATGSGPNNTATETSLIGTPTTGSTTIPANTLLAGALTEFKIVGQITTPVTPDNLTFNMYMGATKVATGTITGSNIASLTTQSFTLKADLFTLTGGASCAFVVEDVTLISGALVGGAVAPIQGTGTTFDCTTTEVFSFKAKWAGAQVGESIFGQGSGLYTPGAPVTSVFGAIGAVNIPVTTTDISTPSNPSSGKTTWYTKSGTLCALNPSGTETCTGSGGGGSITVGTFASLPGSCSSGAAYIATDSPYQFYCNGSTFDSYIFGYKVGRPVLGNFTQVNTGNTTFTTNRGGIGFVTTSSGSDSIQELKDAGITTAGPYTIDAAFMFMTKNTTNSVGLGLTDGTKLAMITVGFEAGTFITKVVKFSNNTTFASNQNETGVNVTGPLVWLRIVDDGTGSGTARTYYYSADGITYQSLLNEGHTTFLTATNGMIGINAVTTPSVGATFVDYLVQ